MAPKQLQQEIDRDPFVPVRLHLASGKTIDIRHAGAAWILSYGLLVFHGTQPGKSFATGYDVINYRLIEKVEQLSNGRRMRKPKSP